MDKPGWLVQLDRVHSSYSVLLLLALAALTGGFLFRIGLIGWAMGHFGGAVRRAIRGGFLAWERLLSWAPWPVFLALLFGILGVGWTLGPVVPGVRILCGVAPLLMGVAACLAYMYIDIERYEVERGYKAVHTPLKGQALAAHLAQYGHRVHVPLLAAATLGMVGGFALLNQGLYESVGRRWYSTGDDGTAPAFADFLAYELINLLGVVDVLDLAKTSRLFQTSFVRNAAWPATAVLAAFKGFFTLILLQQVFASVRQGRVLAETIADFWSPHESIHERARNALPQYGALAVGPLLESLRAAAALTKEQRDQMPAILAAIGPVAAPALVRCLADPQEHMRAIAVSALGRLRAREAVPPLVALLRDPSDFVRRRLAEALGDMGGPDPGRARRPPRARLAPAWRPWRWGRARPAPPVDPIGMAVGALRAGLSDESAAVRTEAARALGRLGDPARAEAPHLYPLLADADESVRCRAAETLGRLGRGDGTTVAALADLLADPSAAVMAAAANALAGFKREAAPAVAALIPLLQHREEEVRAAAAAAIAAVGPLDGGATEALVEGLTSPDTVVRAQTAEALGSIGAAAQDAVPALVEALGNGNDHVRGKAVEALGKIGEGAAEAAVPGLVRALRDRDGWIGALAAEALGQMGESADDAAPALVRSLGHVNARVRANAAEALGRLGVESAGVRAALERAARDGDGAVRARALEALGAIGKPTEGARRATLDGLGDPDPLVRAAAVGAVGGWGEPDAETVAGLTALLADANDEVKVQAIRALPKVAGATPGAIDGLCRRLLEDDSPLVQMAAAQALGRLGPAAAPAGPALLRATLTGDEGVREDAVRAMALIRPPEAAEAFAAGLKDASADIRRIASGGWMKVEAIPEAIVPALVDALQDTEHQVRANAAHALARLEALPPEAVPLLIACTADPNDGLRMNAAAALRLAPSGTASDAMRHLVTDPNPRVRLIAAGVLLGEDPDDAAAGAALAEALADPAPRVRASALGLIENMGEAGGRYRKELEARNGAEPDESVRAHLDRVREGLPQRADGASG